MYMNTHILLSICRLAVEISSKLEANDKESDVLLARNSPAAVAEEYHLLITGPWLDAKRALDLTNPEDEYKESKVRLLRHIIMVTYGPCRTARTVSAGVHELLLMCHRVSYHCHTVIAVCTCSMSA